MNNLLNKILTKLDYELHNFVKGLVIGFFLISIVYALGQIPQTELLALCGILAFGFFQSIRLKSNAKRM